MVSNSGVRVEWGQLERQEEHHVKELAQHKLS